MDKRSLLIVDRQKVRLKMEKTDREVQKYVDTIKDWFRQQPHLPEIPSDELIEYFLVTNKFSIERTKPKLDMYFTIRNLIPEIFRNQRPELPHQIETVKIVFHCPLPKLTEELHRVIVTKIVGEAHLLNVYDLIAHQLNINEIRFHEDLNMGDILIVDLEQISIGHVIKFTPIHVKKAVFILEEVYSSRLKGLHLINSPPFIDKLVSILKSVMKQKMIERIHVHQSAENLAEYISKDILPRDYGGNEHSVHELSDLWLLKLGQYKERFEKLDTIKIDENLRPCPLVNDDLLGYHGNFRKLDID